MKLLRAEKIIDSDIEGYYVHFPLVEQIATQVHQHDFHEIFLIVTGSVNHHVNDATQVLTSGSLVFVRPDDAHFYSNDGNANCELINLAFLSRTFSHMVEYLQLDMVALEILRTPLSPHIRLSNTEHKALTTQLKTWGRGLYRDKSHSRIVLRALLAQLIGYFQSNHHAELSDNSPEWLKQLTEEMHITKNLVEGRDALMRLANRTPEYVGRAFKTYLGVTPSQFINDLRLDYASELLLQSNDPIIEICYEVGFGNLSHFYHLFKDRWGCSPLEFRKQNRHRLIP